jgi:hypothetical protein
MVKDDLTVGDVAVESHDVGMDVKEGLLLYSIVAD